MRRQQAVEAMQNRAGGAAGVLERFTDRMNSFTLPHGAPGVGGGGRGSGRPTTDPGPAGGPAAGPVRHAAHGPPHVHRLHRVMSAAAYGESYVAEKVRLHILMDVREALCGILLDQSVGFYDTAPARRAGAAGPRRRRGLRDRAPPPPGRRRPRRPPHGHHPGRPAHPLLAAHARLPAGPAVLHPDAQAHAEDAQARAQAAAGERKARRDPAPDLLGHPDRQGVRDGRAARPRVPRDRRGRDGDGSEGPARPIGGRRAHRLHQQLPRDAARRRRRIPDPAHEHRAAAPSSCSSSSS